MTASNSQEKLLLCTLDPVHPGEAFEKIPLHVTVMPWFRLSGSERAFHNALINLTYETAPIRIEGGAEALFGPDNDVRVRMLQRIGSLATLHSAMGDIIERFSGEVDSAYIGEHYAPHVTYLNDSGLEKGETRTLRAMQLIRRGEKPEEKIVEQTYSFQARNKNGRA